jgi:hypothetical protein
VSRGQLRIAGAAVVAVALVGVVYWVLRRPEREVDEASATEAIGAPGSGPPAAASAARIRRVPAFTSAPPASAPIKKPALAGGTISREGLHFTIKKTVRPIKECYEKLLQSEPEAGGRLVVKFTIEERGGVGRLSAATVVPEGDGGTNELRSFPIEQCILSALAAETFEAPVGGPAELTYPFQFQAKRRYDGGEN